MTASSILRMSALPTPAAQVPLWLRALARLRACVRAHPRGCAKARTRRALTALLVALLAGPGLLAGCGGKLSDNADLEALSLSSGSLTPAFDPAVQIYDAALDNGVASITVTPRSADGDARVTVQGGRVDRGDSSPAIALNVGVNTINIVVTSEDDTVERSYVVRVVRRAAAASSSAALSSLLLSSGTLEPAFSAEITAYTASVANSVDSLRLTPFSGQLPSSLTVAGQAVADGSASPAVPLAVGENPISVVVASQDASTQRTYTVTITRAAP
jgi:hypothetical protein